ncbi:MAG: clan AA aspartic protease [Chloroflexi bacterium]|nr:clan AA aspartic protease [Chloroflexota bacterium]
MTQQIRLTLPQWATDNVVLVNVRLNEHTTIRMLLDTGAKYTIITPAVATRLGAVMESAPRVSVTTATQREVVSLINVDQVDLHGLLLRDVECAVLNLPDVLGVDGLLGMSFLKRCRLVLDIPNRRLELETD